MPWKYPKNTSPRERAAQRLRAKRCIGHDEFVRRYWLRVQKTDTCWLWTKKINNNGYGQMRYLQRRTVLVHRFALFIETGQWPTLPVDHKCFVRKCVNPAHLEEVSCTENNRRALARKRSLPS